MQLYDEIIDLVDKIKEQEERAKVREENKKTIAQNVEKSVNTVVDVLDRTVNAIVENVNSDYSGTHFTVSIGGITIHFSEDDILQEVIGSVDIDSQIDLLVGKNNFGEAVLKVMKERLRKRL